MKKILFLFLPLALLACSPFESEKAQQFDLSAFDTKSNETNKMASENSKIKCRYVCDRKIYKEQKIADAISFYKNSKEYSFK